VVWICNKYPSAVGDYAKLIAYFWKYLNKVTTECDKCHERTTVWIEDFSILARPETITRAYREAVIRKEIIESPEVKASKKKLELRHRRAWRIS
jgi:hypothetical protein